MIYSLTISHFLEDISSLSHSNIFLFLCIFHLRRVSYFSLLFSRTLRSFEYIFLSLICLWILFFSQIFVAPPQTITLPSCISFSLGWFITTLKSNHQCPLWPWDFIFLSNMLPRIRLAGMTCIWLVLWTLSLQDTSVTWLFCGTFLGRSLWSCSYWSGPSGKCGFIREGI